MPQTNRHSEFPQLTRSGADGLVVRFADGFNEPANRAALALRAAVESRNWEEVTETAASLVSTLLRFDPLRTDVAALETRLTALLNERDWRDTPLPSDRRRVILPACFDPEIAPSLEAAAHAAGLSLTEFVSALCAAPLRVMTIGFAPGFPYIGELPAQFDLPRQRELTPRVPAGALCLAVRQLVLFPTDSQTGWHHIAQTAARPFAPESQTPFLLRAGDEVQLHPIPPEALTTEAAHPITEPLT